ncbi:MAG: ShlB/FhaC/HecB family hemolysin secretion/activation protein [Pseudomonadota bacterium]
MPDTTEAPQFERKSLLTDLDIPAVKDRDPDPQSGPRLNVKEFRIQGLVEFPDQGITREKIIQQVEAIRFDMMGEGKLLESGYTLDELGKVSDLIADIETETQDQHVGPLEVQKLVFLIREQRRQRGITLGMIETVANTITRYYRENGFILAKAYIPKQQVREGVVTLTVLLGELGEVTVQNNKRYSAKTIQNIFKSDLAKPVTNDLIEENLYLINDLPGISVQGYFEPGSQVGDTKLNVNVTSEQWYNATVRVDNHGSARSGEYRAYTEFRLHNPLTIGDQLEVGVLGTFDPQNSTYGSLRYNVPVLSSKVKFSAGVSNNDFESNNSLNLPILGESKVFDAGLKYQLKRGRVKNLAAGVKVSKIESTLRIGQISGGGLDDTLQNIELFGDFDLLNEKARVLHQGNISIIATKFVAGVEDGQEESAYMFGVDYSRLSFINIPFTKVESKMVLRLSAQYSGVALASVNQYALAGPTRTRGFSVTEYSADDAIFLGADWIFKGPGFNGLKISGERFDNMVQPFMFADVGYGVVHSLKNTTLNPTQDTGDDYAQLADVGFGLKLNYKENMRGNLIIAFPVAAKNSTFVEGEKPGDGINIYFDMQYGF